MTTGPTPYERLSLDAAAAIDRGALQLMEARPGLAYAAACREVLSSSPFLEAAYTGDVARAAELAQQARTAELRARQATHLTAAMAAPAYPRSGAPRPIGGPQDLRPGEVMLARLGPPSAGGGTFAERLA